MDPVSIVAAAVSLSTNCVKISKSLYIFIDETKNVDQTLSGLQNEVESLSSVLENVASVLKLNTLTLKSVPLELGSVAKSLLTTLQDCASTLDQLDEKLGGAASDYKVVKQVKLSVKMGDVQLLRQRIQSHTGAASLAMQAIMIHLNAVDAKIQDVTSTRFENQLRQIAAQNEKMNRKLDEMARAAAGANDQQDDAAGERVETDRIINNMKRLVHSTNAYTSSIAASRADMSDIANRSVLGDPLTEDKQYLIREWMVDAERRNAATSNSHMPLVPEITGTSPGLEDVVPSTDMPWLLYDSDMAPTNDEEHARQSLDETVKAMMDRKDFAAAEWYLRRLLSRTSLGHKSNSLRSIESIQEAKLLLAEAYRAQGKLDEALDLLETFLETSSQDTLPSFAARHLLAEIYTMRKVFTEAEKHCKAAVEAKRNVLGTEHPSFQESLGLLKSIELARDLGTGSFDGEKLYAENSTFPNMAIESRFSAGALRVPSPPPYTAATSSSRSSEVGTGPRSMELSFEDGLFRNEIEEVERLCNHQKFMDAASFAIRMLNVRFGEEEVATIMSNTPRKVFWEDDFGNHMREGFQAGFLGFTSGLSMPHILTELASSNLLQLLLERGAYVDTQDAEGNTPLLLAARHGYVHLISMLLKHGADVNARNIDGDTPLLLTAKNGFAKSTDMLLKSRADIEAKDKDGYTPLALTVVYGRFVTLKQLLLPVRARTSIEAKDNLGNTPLLLAASHGQIKEAEILLSKSVKIEARNDLGNTPLLVASGTGNNEMVKLLLRYGASTKTKNLSNVTPFMLAEEMGFQETAKLLDPRSARVIRRVGSWFR
ncbi:hypothetical protein FQN53_008754 [Emmonsiellopsis sp. PD_33]|nr:hypothetical protein FQN53_008754 [Emmonsiellopsis sp. PD_33]